MAAREPERRKVVVRNLPPALPEATFRAVLDDGQANSYDWYSFVPGKVSTKRQQPSRAYVSFKQPAAVLAFKARLAGVTFANERGVQQPCSVEYAPYQRTPPARVKRDPREGTIEKDADYIAFLEALEREQEALPSAEAQLERREAAAAAAGTTEAGKAKFVTPLMQFLKEKHSLKAPEPRRAPPPRKGGASGRGRSTPLAPIGEDDEAVRPLRKPAPKLGAKGKEAQGLGGTPLDPAAAAKAAAERALSRPTKPSAEVVDLKVRPGFSTWAPRLVGRLRGADDEHAEGAAPVKSALHAHVPVSGRAAAPASTSIPPLDTALESGRPQQLRSKRETALKRIPAASKAERAGGTAAEAEGAATAAVAPIGSKAQRGKSGKRRGGGRAPSSAEPG